MSKNYRFAGFLFGLLVIISLISSCSSGVDKLKTENDSLRQQLKITSKVVETMKTVKIMLDSIDATRHSVQSGGKIDTIENYSNRMADLKEYVKKTEDQIKTLEAAVAEEDVNNQSYMMLIDALKDELRIRNEEIGIIQDNQDLKAESTAKALQLDEIETKLNSKKEELKLYEIRIKELVRTMKISEADSYFAQAGAVEEAAKRTKLAPNKKKETYQEALNLYQKALKLGKKEAKAKVKELKEKID